MPEPGEHDDAIAHQFVGEARGSEQQLKAGFAKYANPDNLRIAKGWFEESFPRFSEGVGTIAILHIDADWYESVKLALETFYPELSPGGYCAVDDYGFWSGTRRAVDEFRAMRGISAPIVSSYYWRKPMREG
jgi:O-methyltransferase